MPKRSKLKLFELIKKIKEDLYKRKLDYSYDWLGRSLAFNNYPPRDILSFLKSTEKGKYSLIYSIKNSKKEIDIKPFDPLLVAQNYENIGANALNVYTQPHFFKGEIELLTAIRRYVSTPLIMNDFIFDNYQLLEAVVYGADSVILKANILTKKELKELFEFSLRLGMEPIVEICDKKDLTNAIFSGAQIIDINSQDFDSKIVDENLSQKLLPLIPNGKTILLSGMKLNKKQMKNFNYLGIDGFFLND